MPESQEKAPLVRFGGRWLPLAAALVWPGIVFGFYYWASWIHLAPKVLDLLGR